MRRVNPPSKPARLGRRRFFAFPGRCSRLVRVKWRPESCPGSNGCRARHAPDRFALHRPLGKGGATWGQSLPRRTVRMGSSSLPGPDRQGPTGGNRGRRRATIARQAAGTVRPPGRTGRFPVYWSARRPGPLLTGQKMFMIIRERIVAQLTKNISIFNLLGRRAITCVTSCNVILRQHWQIVRVWRDRHGSWPCARPESQVRKLRQRSGIMCGLEDRHRASRCPHALKRR